MNAHQIEAAYNASEALDALFPHLRTADDGSATAKAVLQHWNELYEALNQHIHHLEMDDEYDLPDLVAADNKDRAADINSTIERVYA